MIKNLNVETISVEMAKEIKSKLLGIPSVDRVLIAVKEQKDLKVGSLYVPKTDDKLELPRKGVIITTGILSEEYKQYTDYLSTGYIIHYGLYAGKEIDIPLTDKDSIDITDMKFYVLSLNEIIFIESNNQ